MKTQSLKCKIRLLISSVLIVFLFFDSSFLLAQQQEIEDNYNSGQWDKNVNLINTLLTNTDTSQVCLDLTELTILKAKQYYMKSSHQNFPLDSTYAIINAASSLIESNNNKKDQSDVFQLIGQLEYSIAFEQGNFLTARNYFQNALSIRKQINDPQRISESLFYIGLTYEQTNKIDSAMLFYNEAYQLATKYLFKIEQSFAARHLGSVNESLNNSTEASRYYQESLEKRIEAKYYVGIPYALILLGDYNRELNSIKADSLYNEAVIIAKKYNVLRAQANALNALGELHERNYEKATFYFAEALKLSTTFNYAAGERRAREGLLRCTKKE